MNILLIGNGFDLAHGLPTTYKDFLNFADDFCVRVGEKGFFEENFKVSNRVEKYIEKLFSDASKVSIKDEYVEMLSGNVWLNHFYNVNIKNGWIDFESEISRVIQSLDAARKFVLLQSKERSKESYHLEQWQCDTLQYVLGHPKAQNAHNYSVSLEFFKLCPEKLYRDLNRLIRALELYLNDCVNSLEIKEKKIDISSISVDYLISFNYTNTYERVYTSLEASRSDYLHGKAKDHSSVEECNLVLGIDEYLSQPDRDNDNEYIRFKKFFQRIYKKTGCEYVKWVENLENSPLRNVPNPPEHHLYIYGHSLDITDKDVLSRLIRSNNMKTTIYYYSKDAYAAQIANLVKVLGEEDLIKMVYGNSPKIKFVQQQG